MRWREALAGGIVAAALIDALKVGFVVYIGYLATYRAVYGALAVLPIFLLWMYIVWGAVLYGAVVAAALPRWRVGHRDVAVVAAVERLGLGLALIAELPSRRARAARSRPRRWPIGSACRPPRPRTISPSLSAPASSSPRPPAAGCWRAPLDSLTLLDFYRALGLPLAQSLDAAAAFSGQARVAEALHRIAAVEVSALARPLSEVLAEPHRPAPRHLVTERR